MAIQETLQQRFRTADIPYELFKNQSKKKEIIVSNLKAKITTLFNKFKVEEKAVSNAPSNSITFANCDPKIHDIILKHCILYQPDQPENNRIITLKDAIKDKNFDMSKYSAGLDCLAGTLQEMKGETPEAFNAISNLDNDEKYKDGKPAGKGFYIMLAPFEGKKESGVKAAYTPRLNTLILNSKAPSSSSYYHEFVHAADDGKITNKKGKESDLVSNADPVLSAKIVAYRKKMTKTWINNYSTIEKFIDSMAKKDKEGARYELKKLSDTFWFVKDNSKDNKVSIEMPGVNKKVITNLFPFSVKEYKIPYLLDDNNEIIAWALQILKYGTPKQQELIKNDKDLMDIINTWKSINPKQ